MENAIELLRNQFYLLLNVIAFQEDFCEIMHYENVWDICRMGKKTKQQQKTRNQGLHNILCVKMTALSSPMLPAEGWISEHSATHLCHIQQQTM